jgi:hypothetical protein
MIKLKDLLNEDKSLKRFLDPYNWFKSNDMFQHRFKNVSPSVVQKLIKITKKNGHGVLIVGKNAFATLDKNPNELEETVWKYYNGALYYTNPKNKSIYDTLIPKLVNSKNEVNEATLTEKKYYVTYNLGRGRGKDLEKEFDQKSFKTTDKPKVFNSYNDAKKYAEKMEKMFQHSIGGGTAYWVSDEKMNPIKEAKSDYEVYHKSYTSAINAARAYAEKKGFEINDDDAFRQIGMGPRKPSEGKTNKFSIELSKDGKVQRKKLQIQVYGMKNSYELNAYIQ